MKDWLREYSLTIAVFAALALLASLISGIAAGNPFGTIVARAVLAAVLFGGFGAGARYVVVRFLLGQGGADEEPERAPTVDIVLPEVRPPTSSEAEPVEELTAAAPEEARAPVGAQAAVPSEPEPASEAPANLDELSDFGTLEPAEEPSLPSDAGAPAGGSPPPAAPERASEAARERLAGQDPSTLARAVRTLLKREER